MEFTGKVIGVVRDYASDKFRITFDVNENDAILNGYDAIKDLDKLSIKAVKYRHKRSLDANAYAWVLMSKIASALSTSKEEIYEHMLRQYGQLYEDEDGVITITVKNNVDMDKIDGHWLLIKKNEKFSAYAMIKGSSEYDSAEMSYFIDKIVSEAKSLGIETMTPDELQEMKERWNA